MTMLDRKLARDLTAAKGLLLAIAGIIGVGVMCYVTMQSSYHNLARAKIRYYRQSRMADFWIDLKKAPLAEIARLEQLPQLVQLTPRISFSATVDLEDSPQPINGLVLSLPDERQPVTNDIVLRRGGYFTPRRANEVIVNEAFAVEHRLRPGDWIHLLLNNRRQELLVVGTAISSEFTYLVGPGSIMPDPEHFGVFYVKQTFAEDVFDFEGAANQVVGRMAPGFGGDVEAVLRDVESLLDDYGVFSTTPLKQQASNQFLSGEIDGLKAFATILTTCFLIVGALVLNVLITRLARQQRTVIGTLKALGYSDWKLFRHFLKYGVTVGAAGGMVGCVGGYMAATGITDVYKDFFEFPDLRSELHWYTYGIGMAVSMGCAMLGSVHGARAVLALQPAAAMRPEPPSAGGAILLERVTWLWRRLGSNWRVALRGLVRHRVRTAIGMLAAGVGAALLVTGFMMMEAQDYLIEFQFRQVTRSDIDVTFGDEHGRDALRELGQMPGVLTVEPLLNVSGTFVNGAHRRKAGITGLSHNATLTVPRDQAGRRIHIPPTGLVISRVLAELLDLKVGDRVTMEPAKGDRRPFQLEVVEVTDSYMGQTAYANIEHLSDLIGEAFAMNGAQLTASRDANLRDSLHRELKQTAAVQSVILRDQLIEHLVETLLSTQGIFITSLVSFAGIIFFGSMVNASMVSLAERQREVATLRAIGYSPWRVGGLFLRENLVTNLAGTLVGLPVGYFLMWLTAMSYNNDLIRIPVITDNWIWGVTLLLSLLFALAAHAFVQWRIHRMDFVDALKVKE
ncbi:MAG: ABC transporter permease [Planctomycetales bacterium]|nr:ABC transporter permease [Planctomycetales bacterium]